MALLVELNRWKKRKAIRCFDRVISLRSDILIPLSIPLKNKAVVRDSDLTVEIQLLALCDYHGFRL